MGSIEGPPRRVCTLRRAAGIRNRLAAASVAAGVVISSAACGGGGTSDAKSPSASSPSGADLTAALSPSTSAASTSPSSSSTQAGQAGQDALAAYHAAFADWVAAAATSNYQDPVLAHHMSGQALSYVTRSMYINLTKGAVSKGAPVLNPTVGQLVPANDPTEVVVNDKMSDSSWLLYTTDGHLFNDVPGGCHQTQALVVKKDGVWKVDQFAINKTGTC